MTEPAANPYAVSEAAASQAEHPANNPIPYSGFWRRAVAFVLDYLLAVFVTNLLSRAVWPRGAPNRTAAWILFGASMVVLCLYLAVLESSDFQATFGKRILRLKVADLRGEPLGFGRALGRMAARVASILTLGVGFGMAAFTDRRQALHDKIAGTVVVRREETASDIEHAGPAPHITTPVRALMVAASLLPVLAVLAVRWLTDLGRSEIRSEVIDGLAAAAPFQEAVEAARAQGKSFDSMSNDSLSLAADEQFSDYVESIRIWKGALEINFGPDSNEYLRGGHVVLVPALTHDSHVVWICGHAAPGRGVKATIDDYQKYTNIHEMWLPPECSYQHSGALEPAQSADP